MAVLFHNKKEDNLAQKSSNTVLSSLKEKIEESNLKISDVEKDLNKDLNQYDGYIKIAKLNLELPVMKKTNSGKLKKITMYIFRHGKRFKPDNSRPTTTAPTLAK
ncbi:MAG: hypothetical protein ACLRR3_04445 [Eubacterium sp.]